MKTLVALLFAAPLVVAAIPLALGGDPFVVAIVAGSVAFFALQNLAAATQRRQPRKADPAKIARLERELGFEPPLRGPREWVFTETGDIRPADEEPHWSESIRPENVPSAYAQRMAEWGGQANVVDTEAPTTVPHRPPDPIPGVENIARPAPIEHTVDDCPRPESCVMAHPCRKCGADRGEACVGDLHLDTRALAQPE